MPAYAIIDVHIIDIADYLQYQQALQPLLQEVGARYLARGGELEILQGKPAPGRLLLLEFPTMESLRAFYRSASYRALEPQRNACSRASIIAVNGLQLQRDVED